MKKALITGIAGQDGSYLAELLLSKGYEVHGIIRRKAFEGSQGKLQNVVHILDKIHLHSGSLDNAIYLAKLINDVQPNECYHLASSSFVNYSFGDEFHGLTNNVESTYNILSALKEFSPNCKLYFAGSSEMFGTVSVEPQNEFTPFHPRAIYGISKLTGYHLVRNFCERDGLFASVGIMYNHESPRRGFEFVTRKITSTVAKIKLGIENKLYLGNLDAVRDWGYAPDYVQAMWNMLQMDTPDQYVIATGKMNSVCDFVNKAFGYVGLNYRDFVYSDPRFYRDSEKIPLRGDAAKAKDQLGWDCTKSIDEIIAEMIDHDLFILQRTNN